MDEVSGTGEDGVFTGVQKGKLLNAVDLGDELLRAIIPGHHEMSIDVCCKCTGRPGRTKIEVEPAILFVQLFIHGQVLEVNNLAPGADLAEPEHDLDGVVTGIGQPVA